ncbi:MAG: hypothetical protein HKN24_15120, partial [Acidimicrobiales bacterium]|nr:hypothetical protein [Acidimicrobiales bacterium]
MEQVRRFEPLLEELTGPCVLGILGVAMMSAPSISVGGSPDSSTIGLIAVIGSVLGLVALWINHRRLTTAKATVKPIHSAPGPGEIGPWSAMLVIDTAWPQV